MSLNDDAFAGLGAMLEDDAYFGEPAPAAQQAGPLGAGIDNAQEFIIRINHPDESMGIRYKRYEGEPVIITEVEPGRACERAGLPVGWAILAVDGFEVIDEESLQLALLQWRDRGVSELHVILQPWSQGFEGDGTADRDGLETFFVVAQPGTSLGLKWARKPGGYVVVTGVSGPFAAAGVPVGFEIHSFHGVDVIDEDTLHQALEAWRTSGDSGIEVRGVMGQSHGADPNSAHPVLFWPSVSGTEGVEYPPPPRPYGGGVGGPLPRGGANAAWLSTRPPPGERIAFGDRRPAGYREGPLVGRIGGGRSTRLQRVAPVNHGDDTTTGGGRWAANAVRRTRLTGGTAGGGAHSNYTTPEFEQFVVGGPRNPVRRPDLADAAHRGQAEPLSRALADPPSAAVVRALRGDPLTHATYKKDKTGAGFYSVVSF